MVYLRKQGSCYETIIPYLKKIGLFDVTGAAFMSSS